MRNDGHLGPAVMLGTKGILHSSAWQVLFCPSSFRPSLCEEE